MASTLYLEGNFLPDFWLKPNLFYQKLASSKSKVILISDSLAPDLKSWLQVKNPELNYHYFDPNSAAEFLDNPESLESLSQYQLFIEDREGSIPKEIYTKSLNARPHKAFVLARWIDWVASSKSTLTAAFTSLSVTKSVINRPSELYQFVDLFPESEPLVLLWQEAIHNVPMEAYYIFNKDKGKLKPFSVFDSNQKIMLSELVPRDDSSSRIMPDLKDVTLALERIEQLIETTQQREEMEENIPKNQLTAEISKLKQLVERQLLLEYGWGENDFDEARGEPFKDIKALIHAVPEEGAEANVKAPLERSEENAPLSNPMTQIWTGVPRTSPESNDAED